MTTTAEDTIEYSPIVTPGITIVYLSMHFWDYVDMVDCLSYGTSG
ncbi:hypothetical protein ACJDU8_10760 [Clostridium sp. WILCCON 0269]|uniref:Uncharacterized protein n=1 Tax=Candidatus Clostridium eludens TaxID=3381663 RepID=A0ABW8SLE9_9CLOT